MINMKIQKILILAILISGFSATSVSVIAAVTRPLGGKVTAIPSIKMTSHETQCTSLVTCAGKGAGVPVAGVWTNLLDGTGGKTFSLIPDMTPISKRELTYYVPPGVLSRTSSGPTVGKWILGLFTSETIPVGECLCTYDLGPYVTESVVNVSDKVGTVFLHGSTKNLPL